MLQLRDPGLFRETCLTAAGWQSAASGDIITVRNPATGEAMGSVPSFGTEEVSVAISGAETAFQEWSRRTARERSAILKQWHALMLANCDDLALLITSEQGKPLAEARSEVLYAASFVEWFAEEAKRVCGETFPVIDTATRITTLRQPVGVAAAITPWNFPAAMITRKVAPALAAGCSMIVRPAELTPFTALALGVLAERAGVPPGVLQILTGDGPSMGAVLTSSATVRKLSFTGSTVVGRKLMAQSAGTVKRVSLELGGNAPFIVFSDAHIELAAQACIAAKFRNAGQTCVCANRILVQRDIAERFGTRLSDLVRALKVGPGTDAASEIGPLISLAAIEKVEAHIRDATAKGARLVVGGERLGGQFISPAVLMGVTPAMDIAQEETFGPLAPIFVFDTEEEAISMANDTIYGLAAYFFTNDFRRVHRVSEALEYGMIGHNTGQISNEIAPFGGIKQSGIGREGSRQGIEEYLETKYMCSRL